MKYLILTILIMLTACSIKPRNEFVSMNISTFKTDKLKLTDTDIYIAFFKNPLMKKDQIALEIYTEKGLSIMSGNSLIISLNGDLYSFESFNVKTKQKNENVGLYLITSSFLDRIIKTEKVEFRLYVSNTRMDGYLKNESKEDCKQFLNKVM